MNIVGAAFTCDSTSACFSSPAAVRPRCLPSPPPTPQPPAPTSSSSSFSLQSVMNTNLSSSHSSGFMEASHAGRKKKKSGKTKEGNNFRLNKGAEDVLKIAAERQREEGRREQLLRETSCRLMVHTAQTIPSLVCCCCCCCEE